MLPWPPHWATSSPPGRRCARRRAKSASWSAIQWKVAVERIASACEAEVEGRRGRPRAARRGRPGARARRRSSRPTASTPITRPLRQAREQRLGDPARAAAGVDDRLVAASAAGARAPRGPSPPWAWTAGRSRRRSRSGPRSLLAAAEEAREEAHDRAPTAPRARAGCRGPAWPACGCGLGGAGGAWRRRGRCAAADASAAAPPADATAASASSPGVTGAGRGAAPSASARRPAPARTASVACRHCEKSRIIRLEMSSIIPPRPKRARRPVIVKSVMTSTTVSLALLAQGADDRRVGAALAALVGALGVHGRGVRCLVERVHLQRASIRRGGGAELDGEVALVAAVGAPAR